MKNLLLIIFSSLFIYIDSASAEGGLSASTRSNETEPEETYEDDSYDDGYYYDDDIDVDLIGPAGVTGTIRRSDRRRDRREVAPRRR